MAIRHVYLRIEEIAEYSPVEPSAHAAANYRKDCMHNTGHEGATVPLSEINARRLTALVYREYLDPDYLVPKPDKLVLADVNEPVFMHRVPGTVIYVRPGDRLIVDVFNADIMPHSFHVHGLRYGIDSDGSWPFGTQATDGRRSDEICPGQMWRYRFDVKDDMVGAWPFHDHSRHIGESVNRGLFGGIVVLSKEHHPPKSVTLPPLVKDFMDKCCKETKDEEDELDPGHGGSHIGHGGHVGHGGHSHDHENDDEHGNGHDDEEHGHEHGHGEGGHGGGHGGGHHGARDPEHRAVLDFLDEWSQLHYVHPYPHEKDMLHVPIFFHMMSRRRGIAAFDSGPFSPASPPFEVTFGPEGTISYHCEIHAQMQGTIVVAAGEAPEVSVAIDDTDPMNMVFDPAEARIAPGGKVRWIPGTQLHVIVEDGAGIPSLCLNGRAFVGNTPTIEAHAGQPIRWYVFNLDLGMGWHNFHPHGGRWNFAGQPVDIRSIGPAESFVVDTVAPPVLLLPPALWAKQKEKHHSHAKKYELCGDFLFHCHVEMHMMQGLAGLVRSKQTVWLTDEEVDRVKGSLGWPPATCDNTCPDVEVDRCEQMMCGEWQLVSVAPEVCMMHACLLPNTERVLYFGYGDTRDDQSRILDYSADPETLALPANQPFDVTVPVHDRGLANIWSAEHAYLADAKGTPVVHGGFTPRQTFEFDPTTLTWSHKQPTAEDRFYSTTITLADGKLLTLFGSGSKSLEVYSAGNWAAPIAVPTGMYHHQYYPWTYLLPGGKLFIAGPHVPTQRFNWAAGGITNLESFPTNAGDRSSGGEKGTSVLLPLRPPAYAPQVLIAGGDFGPAKQTAEWIDLSSATPTWQYITRGASTLGLNSERAQQVNSVLLPDGRVMIAGGIDGTDGGPAEIFDPQNPEDGWELCATMSFPRGYHSAAILLADGSVLMGGDKPGAWKSGETTQHERYFPSYFAFARPLITGAPASIAYGAAFAVQTPSPAGIAEVVLLRPGAVTHGFNQSQRMIECVITGTAPGVVQVQAPPDGTVAPPGPYLLFVLTPGRVPSVGHWIRIS